MDGFARTKEGERATACGGSFGGRACIGVVMPMMGRTSTMHDYAIEPVLHVLNLGLCRIVPFL